MTLKIGDKVCIKEGVHTYSENIKPNDIGIIKDISNVHGIESLTLYNVEIKNKYIRCFAEYELELINE